MEASVFAVATALVFYTYVGYPLLLWLLTCWKSWPQYPEPDSWPSVTFLISAYNEGEVLRQKLENALELDYPGKRQIIVVSDCSDDGTDQIAREFADRQIVLERLEQRSGKTVGQNAGVRRADGEILVFSDANSLYDSQALRNLVLPFGDPAIGCVCGELRYLNPDDGGAGHGEGLYWRYEQFLKRRESLIGSLVGANGSIYAVRRHLFEELGARIISDFVMPIRVRRKGARVVYAPDAIAREFSAKSFIDELRRRTRIVARSLYGLWTDLGALNVLIYGIFSIQLVSHKLIRWLVPAFLIAALISSGLLARQEEVVYGVLFAAQLAFYGLAILGALAPTWFGRLGLFYVPAYFCSINLGALLGLLSFLIGRRYTMWKTVKRPG